MVHYPMNIMCVGEKFVNRN